jgi:hypothetical protein
VNEVGLQLQLPLGTPTWENTVASILSINRDRFFSGTDIYNQPGWWALRNYTLPTKRKLIK